MSITKKRYSQSSSTFISNNSLTTARQKPFHSSTHNSNSSHQTKSTHVPFQQNPSTKFQQNLSTKFQPSKTTHTSEKNQHTRNAKIRSTRSRARGKLVRDYKPKLKWGPIYFRLLRSLLFAARLFIQKGTRERSSIRFARFSAGRCHRSIFISSERAFRASRRQIAWA